MQKLIAILLIVAPLKLFAQCDSVTMQYRFNIEGVDFTHAAAWVGGWSHAVIAFGQGSQNICIPECGSLVTKTIVDILNEKFSGQTISAEKATATIWPELRKRLNCKNSITPKESTPH